MADYDVGVLSLTTPPSSALVTSYRPAVSVRNNGVHDALASGILRIYSAGRLIFTTELYSSTIAPGGTGPALAVDYWTPPEQGDYLVIADVTCPLDQVESNNHLAPTLIVVGPGEPPAPPVVAFHATQHEEGGSDEVIVDGLHGLLNDPQTPRTHKSSHAVGGSDELNVGGLRGQLADGQPIADHHQEHEFAGGDQINVDDLAGILKYKQKPQTHDNAAHDPNYAISPHNNAAHDPNFAISPHNNASHDPDYATVAEVEYYRAQLILHLEDELAHSPYSELTMRRDEPNGYPGSDSDGAIKVSRLCAVTPSGAGEYFLRLTQPGASRTWTGLPTLAPASNCGGLLDVLHSDIDTNIATLPLVTAHLTPMLAIEHVVHGTILMQPGPVQTLNWRLKWRGVYPTPIVHVLPSDSSFDFIARGIVHAVSAADVVGVLHVTTVDADGTVRTFLKSWTYFEPLGSEPTTAALSFFFTSAAVGTKLARAGFHSHTFHV